MSAKRPIGYRIPLRDSPAVFYSLARARFSGAGELESNHPGEAAALTTRGALPKWVQAVQRNRVSSGEADLLKPFFLKTIDTMA